MIVESMNQVEIIKEVLKDLNFVHKKSEYLKKVSTAEEITQELEIRKKIRRQRLEAQI